MFIFGFTEEGCDIFCVSCRVAIVLVTDTSFITGNILPDGDVAPGLVAAQKDLERNMAADNLKRGLEKRSDKGDLVDRMGPSTSYTCIYRITNEPLLT